MKTLLHLLMMSLIAFWLGAIALFSIQNVTGVSLQFLNYASIKLPIGVLLTFCAAGGMVGGAIVPLLLPSGKARSRRDRGSADERNAFDFDV